MEAFEHESIFRSLKSVIKHYPVKMLFPPQIFYERFFNTKKWVITSKKIFKKPPTISELKAKATKQITVFASFL
jgi:hypothetical protein